MVEVELFYKLVEAKIRERHSAYLEAERKGLETIKFFCSL